MIYFSPTSQYKRKADESYGTPFDFVMFFCILSELLYLVSPPNIQRLCVRLMYRFWYVKMSNVNTGYGRFSDLIEFLGIYKDYYMFETL